MKAANMLKEILKQISIQKIPKSALGDGRNVIITSVGTERITKQALTRFLEWRRANGLNIDGPFLRLEVVEFLEEYAETHQQKSVDQTRQALGRLLALCIQPIPSLIQTIEEGRAYAWEEVKRVITHQHDRNALSTLLSFDAGLRAIELITLCEEHVRQPSQHREWPTDMFTGRGNVRYMIVTGKGGLRRRIALEESLYLELLKHKRPNPLRVADRGVWYESHFDIGGGHRFSQSFSDASFNALGFSLGAHGLRHAYAQRRVGELKAVNYTFMQAVQLVSTELGHFRPLLTYYRPRN